MRNTDSTLVFGYSPKVKKACFLILIFLYSLEHKERGLLYQIILTSQLNSKEQKKRKKSSKFYARKRNKNSL